MDITDILSPEWKSVGYIIFKAILIYIFLLLLLRISGKRTLSKMSAFDLIITMALGSIFSSSIIKSDVDLFEAFSALTTLVLLQILISWLSVKFDWFEKMVISEHKILFYKGEFIPEAMEKERVTKKEMVAAIREKGYQRQEEIECIILEAGGKLSVIPNSNKH